MHVFLPSAPPPRQLLTCLPCLSPTPPCHCPPCLPAGAYYLRLVGRAYDVYTYLEPLYNDFRRVRVALPDGRFALSHVDEVVDDMLRKDYLYDVALPHIPYRCEGGRAGRGGQARVGAATVRGAAEWGAPRLADKAGAS